MSLREALEIYQTQYLPNNLREGRQYQTHKDCSPNWSRCSSDFPLRISTPIHSGKVHLYKTLVTQLPSLAGPLTHLFLKTLGEPPMVTMATTYSHSQI